MGASSRTQTASRGIACVLKKDLSADKARAGFEAVRKITLTAGRERPAHRSAAAGLLNLITPTAEAADLKAGP